MYALHGRKAIVTGAAHGIGKAIATHLLAEGCEVGILDLDLAAAQATAAELGKNGGKIAVATADVSVRDQVVDGIGKLKDALGPIDILVNNAGICRVGKFLETSEADWKATFGINVDGLFHVSRQIAPDMIARRSGTIVNIASWMGKSGVAAYGAYCASKFAVVSLTQSMAMEFGEFGVRVNAVAPGLIVETKMRDESEILRAAQGLPSMDQRAKEIPLRRAGLPKDVAKAVLFLASDQAEYITGETISVTGGIWND
jgi:NAD(P)-dependent dehydrogenase (short-subunit alcohol dehydrogenase family)